MWRVYWRSNKVVPPSQSGLYEYMKNYWGVCTTHMLVRSTTIAKTCALIVDNIPHCACTPHTALCLTVCRTKEKQKSTSYKNEKKKWVEGHFSSRLCLMSLFKIVFIRQHNKWTANFRYSHCYSEGHPSVNQKGYCVKAKPCRKENLQIASGLHNLGNFYTTYFFFGGPQFW